MARYIDADARDRTSTSIDILSAYKPTADVVEVKYGEWIPCSERLPKEEGDYLVTLDFSWGKELEIGEFFEGEWINPNSHVTVAWMPLPESYKAESENKE